MGEDRAAREGCEETVLDLKSGGNLDSLSTSYPWPQPESLAQECSLALPAPSGDGTRTDASVPPQMGSRVN